MEALSVLVSEVAAIPAFDLAEKNLPGDGEARMGKGATFQHVEGMDGPGDDPLGVLAPERPAPFEKDQKLDDQKPGNDADGRVYGDTVGPRLLRLLGHGAASRRLKVPEGRPRLKRSQMVGRGLLARAAPSTAIDGWVGRRRCIKAGTNGSNASRMRRAVAGIAGRRSLEQGCDLRELLNPPVGHFPLFCPTTGGGSYPLSRRQPFCDEVRDQLSDDLSDRLKAFGAVAPLGSSDVHFDHVEGVAEASWPLHPERFVTFPGGLA